MRLCVHTLKEKSGSDSLTSCLLLVVVDAKQIHIRHRKRCRGGRVVVVSRGVGDYRKSIECTFPLPHPFPPPPPLYLFCPRCL